MKSGFYEAPDGATIRDLFAVCEKENNVYVNPALYDRLVFQADGKSAALSSVLDGVQTVHMLGVALGG
jgi:hypothetical protein